MNQIREILTGIAAKNPHLIIEDPQYLARGSKNSVYSTGNKVIKLGYGKQENGRHALEEWFYGKCPNSPKVHKRGMLFDTPYMILDYAGTEIPKGTEELGSKFGELFRRLHNVTVEDVSGFGWLRYDGGEAKGVFSSNEELKMMYVDILNASAEDIKARKLFESSKELSDIVAQIEDRNILKVVPSLTFHDWNQKNFLKNNGTVTLIDPQPNIEDPLVDYALLELSCDMNYEPLFNTEFLHGFRSTYFEGRMETSAESDKTGAYKLFFSLALFYENEINGKKEVSGKNNKYKPLVEKYVLNSTLAE